MARSTFEGPVLAGDTRFGALRNVGSVTLYQNANLNFVNQTTNTAGFGGVSGVFVASNNIPNSNGVVYNPSAIAYPPTVQTITADNGTDNYRGWVCYIPAGSRITSILIDVIATLTPTSGSFSQLYVSVSNKFESTYSNGIYAYGNTGSAGRMTLTQGATQLANQLATTTDILTPNGQPNLSQVVFTLDINGTTQSSTYTSGRIACTLGYVQADGNVGTATVYPFGNFD